MKVERVGTRKREKSRWDVEEEGKETKCRKKRGNGICKKRKSREISRRKIRRDRPMISQRGIDRDVRRRKGKRGVKRKNG